MARRRKRRRTAPARRPFKPFLLGFLVLLGGGLGGGAYLFFRELTATLPPVGELLDYHPPAATRVLAADGTVIGEFFIEKRYVTPIAEIPRLVQLAFVAAEDASFFQHAGVDLLGIARAAIANYRAGATRQGGSTITQQVVKSLLLSPERSYERKIKELILALRLERELSKEAILGLYLNQIYLGSGAYGVQAAAREYFGKDISELDLAEAALLAGLPQAPSRYSPFSHFDRAKARQRYVLDRMVAEGFITPAEARAAAGEPLALRRSRAPGSVGPAPYFVEQVRRALVARYGSAGTYQLGLEVHTTLDRRLQRIAERALQDGIRAIDERQGFRGPLRRLRPRELAALEAQPAPDRDLPPVGSVLEVVVVPDAHGRIRRPDGGLEVRWAGGRAVIPRRGLRWALAHRYRPRAGDVLAARVVSGPALELEHENGTQGALIAMAPATGDIRALVGGLDFRASQFNRATQALRQPGSSFKPLIYTAAMDRGFTPATVINDAPVTFRIGPGQVWHPQNFSRRYYGPTTLRTALTHSRNVVTAKLVDAMGLDYLIRYLPRFGFRRPFPHNLSIALGTSEVTLLEMVEAYGVFPNLGIRVEPRFITEIRDANGRLLERRPVSAERVIAPETAYITVNLMENAMRHGTGRRALIGRPAAGKTGTTNDQRDAWFIGTTPELLAGVWIGYDHEKTLGRRETGGRAAAPIWKSFMAAALDGVPISDFPVPPGIVLVNIDPATGLRARPTARHAVLEAFRRGTEPQAFAPLEPTPERQRPSAPYPPPAEPRPAWRAARLAAGVRPGADLDPGRAPGVRR